MLSPEAGALFEQVLLEIRSAPVLPRDSQANAVATSLVVATLLRHMLTSIEGLLIVASVIAVHELGHYAAMRCFGYHDPDVLCVPLPASDASKQRSPSVWQHIIVLLLGPVPGLLGATLLALAHPGAEHLSRDSMAWHVLVASSSINGLNLLPLVPFDGGGIARILFFAEHPATQLRLGSMLAFIVGLPAIGAHRWETAVAAVVAVVFGFSSAAPTRVGGQFRSRRLAELATAPRLAKDAPKALLRELFEHSTSNEGVGALRSQPASAIARFLSRAYAAAVTPTLGARQRFALGVVYLGVSVPFAFLLIDLFVGTTSR